MLIDNEDNISVMEAISICKSVSNDNIEIMKDPLTRPKTSDFINKYEAELIYINSELNISDNLIDRLSDKRLALNCTRWKCLKNEFNILN